MLFILLDFLAPSILAIYAILHILGEGAVAFLTYTAETDYPNVTDEGFGTQFSYGVAGFNAFFSLCYIIVDIIVN